MRPHIMLRLPFPLPANRSLLTLTQATAACAVGLLLAGRIGRPAQRITAATLLGIGALFAVPAVVNVVQDVVAGGPGSERSERRRLDSIRTDSGLPDSAEIF